MSQPLLHAEGISVRRGRRLVLEPCDVTIRPGEVVGLYGPNGARRARDNYGGGPTAVSAGTLPSTETPLS